MLDGGETMFKIAVIVFVFSMFVALFIALTLFILRIICIIKDRPSLKVSLLILLVPGSIGYYIYYKDSSPIKTWYQRLVILMFMFTAIGSIYMAFLNMPQVASWFFYG